MNPFVHAYAGFRVQHFSDAGVYGPNSLGVDLYIVELGYIFETAQPFQSLSDWPRLFLNRRCTLS